MYQVRFETFLQNYQETQYWEDKNYEEKTRGPSYKSIQHTNNLQGYSNDDTIKPMGINNLNDLKWWRIKSIDVSIKLLQHELKGNCLEIGAGGGLGSAYLSSFELVDRVDCLDYSLIAVEKLMPEVHSSIDIANPKKIRRVYGSYDNIKEKNYNFIYGSGALHNSKNLDKTLKEFSFLNFICIDVANGYSEHFSSFLKKVRDKYPTKTLIAGNVVTADMTQELILSGADIVKVGIGPGSVCTTRIQTGVGYPQLSAVIECADAAHGLGAHIIADGGCTCPGDVAKAFGGGADFVMLGGMFAGHEEGGGKKVKKNGSQFIEFYGSSSDTALEKHYGGLSSYRSSEGKKVQLKFRGKIKDTVQNILGGLRSSCTYVGAPSLKQLSKCTTFVRVNQQFNDTFE